MGSGRYLCVTQSRRMAGSNPGKDSAEAYRTRVQAIADYQNAVPIPKWPLYVIGIGSASFSGATTLALVAGLYVLGVDNAIYVLWLVGGGLVLLGIAVLLIAEVRRSSHYADALSLFNEWAEGADEPHMKDPTAEERAEARRRRREQRQQAACR